MNRSVVFSLVVLLSANAAAANPIGDRISRLVDEMVARDPPQPVFDELRSLGDGAVPYLVGRLDDRRKFGRTVSISLPTKGPNHFEAIWHGSAGSVHEALVILLQFMTDQNFPYSHHMDTENERSAAILLWRKWCSTKYSNMVKVCNGAI